MSKEMQNSKGRFRTRKVLALGIALMLVFSMMPYVPNAFAGESEGTTQEDRTLADTSTQEGMIDEGGSIEEEGASTEEAAAEPSSEDAEQADDGSIEDEVTVEDDHAVGAVSEEVEVAPLMQTDGLDSLKVEIGEQGVFQDVDSIGNAITWPLLTAKKQLRITANFDKVGLPGTRTIEVTVPQGYKIIEYAVKSGTPAINGVGQIALSGEADGKLDSSVLTARDGSSWADQAITGYTRVGSASEGTYRVYDGKILYSFNSTCNVIELNVTLGLDQAVMSHAATSCSLGAVSVAMTSDSKNLSTSVSTTVTGLAQSKIHDAVSGGTRTIDANEATGETEIFETSWGLYSYNSSYQYFLMEDTSFSVTYPAGVSFQGFTENYNGISAPADASGGSYADGHLVVTHNSATRTVNFSYSNIFSNHTSSMPGLTLFWKATVDESVINWDDTLPFIGTGKNGSGKYMLGSSATSPETTSPINITIKKPAWDVKVSPLNITRHDWNSQGDYPYDMLIGGFSVQNTGPSKATDLIYKWEFDASLAVRQVTFPGEPGNDITDVVATTNKGTRNASGPFVTSSKFYGVEVNDVSLGLDPDEYIIELTARQSSLNAVSYPTGYTRSAAHYYGRWQAGQEGDATLSVYDGDNTLLVSAIDHTSIGWNRAGIGNVTTTAKKTDGTTGSFYPNETIKFSSVYLTGLSVKESNDIVDPDIVISLPEGINLDQSSVMANSLAGNHGTDDFPLELKSFKQQVISGVAWNTYVYRSPVHQDMIANSDNAKGNSCKSQYITVTFDANVASTCNAYPDIKAYDVVLWDAGISGISASTAMNYTLADSADRAGKGTSYVLGAATTSANIQVVLQPGLQVQMGIRTAGSSTDYYTYDGTDSTIAPVTPDDNAELYLKYENTSQSAYAVGTEIYLPIPKKNQGYSKYFNNKEVLDPVNTQDNTTPEWTGYLDGPISLPGFDTYYSTSTFGVQDDSSGTPVGWVPVTNGDAGWTTSVSDYKQVTMVKFIANAPIVAGYSNQTTFEIELDSSAVLEERNYWRTFQKGWLDAAGNGTWSYGAVVAAEPAKAGLSGMLFNDLNNNGSKDAGEGFANPGGEFTAMLTEQNGAISPLNMTINADGSFESLNSDGTPYHLKAGTYIVTVSNAGTDYGFTTMTSTTRSNTTDGGVTVSWYMDIAQANVASDHSTATFTFVVEAGSSLATEYVGVGVKAASTITYVAGTGVTFATATEKLNHGMSPTAANIPTINATTASAGYDPAKQSWVLDKTVTLKDNTTIAAGASLTRAQLLNVKVTENLIATVSLGYANYKLSFDSQGANEAATLDALEITVDYNTTLSTVASFPANPTKANNTFKGWQYEDPSSPGTMLWLSTTTKMPSQNLELVAVWVPSTGSGNDGDIRIAATNFIMSKAELVAYTAANAATKLSTLVTKGDASAWYDSDKSAVNITDAEFDGGIPTGPGTYPVTYTADDGTDSASVTVNAIIHDQVDGSLGANNFSRDVKDGAITAAQAASLASATVYDALGSATTEVPVADATHLAAINAAIASKTTGDYPLKFTNAAGDEVTITVTLTRSIFDVTFNSQGANEAATLDTLVVPVTKATVIKNASGFPAEPTKPGFTFKGWQYDNPASPGTNIWLTNTSLMPAANVALTAVWVPSSGSGDDGDIRIAATNFIMSKAELDAYAADNAANQLSTLVAKGDASAWYTTDMSAATVTDAEFVGGTPTGAGTYQVTYTADDGTDSASVTVTAIIHDQVDGDLGANDFSHDVKDGPLTPADAIDLSDATVYDALGMDTGEVPAVDSNELTAINDAIANNERGDFPLTFTNAAGDEVTITVTLTRSIHDLTFDSKGADNASDYDSLVVPVTENTVIEDATGFPVDPAKDGYVFRGWQYEDPANSGTMLWLSDATLMPSDHLQLVAVWERGTVITVGKITIVASPFTMTVKEAAAYEAMTPADQLAYMIEKGAAKAWHTDTKVDEPITAIDIMPVSGSGSGLSGGKGEYNVTYYAGTGAEKASATVLLTIYDKITPPKPDTSSIGGNNFTYDIQKGELTEDQIRELASITVYDKYGRPTGEKAILTPADLDTINKMIREGKTGKTSLTFTNAAGQTITVECELFNSKVDPEPKDPTDPTDKDKKPKPVYYGKTKVAKTGDATTAIVFSVVGIGAGALILALVALRRRRTQH